MIHEGANVGNIAEAAFVFSATKRGYEVFLPTTHHTKTDVVVRLKGSPLVGVQIKKAARQKTRTGKYGNSWKFMVGSGKPFGQRKHNVPRYTPYIKGDFHIMAAYIIEHDTWAFYPLTDLIGKPSCRWSEKKGPINNWELFDEFFSRKDLPPSDT